MTSTPGGPLNIQDDDIVYLQEDNTGNTYYLTWESFRDRVSTLPDNLQFAVQRGGSMYRVRLSDLRRYAYDRGPFDFILVQRGQELFCTNWEPIPDLRFFTLEVYDWSEIPQDPSEGDPLLRLVCEPSSIRPDSLTQGVVPNVEAFVKTPSGNIVALTKANLSSYGFEFDEAGTYEVYAVFKTGFSFSDSVGLKSVDWGSEDDMDFFIQSMVSRNPWGSGSFSNCKNLIEIPSYTRFGCLQGTFQKCDLFNGQFDIAGTLDNCLANIAAGNLVQQNWCSMPFYDAPAWNNGDQPFPDITSQTSQFEQAQGLFYRAFGFNQSLDSNTVNFSKIGNWDMWMDSCTAFNQDVSGLHLDACTTAQGMFAKCSSFNQNVGTFNMGNCTQMSGMFDGCTAFNNGGSDAIRYWNVSNMTTASGTFNNCTAFNQSLSNWDVRQVSTPNQLYGFLANAVNYDQDLSQWCVQAVTTKPPNFDLNTQQTPERNPQWGDPCP